MRASPTPASDRSGTLRLPPPAARRRPGCHDLRDVPRELDLRVELDFLPELDFRPELDLRPELDFRPELDLRPELDFRPELDLVLREGTLPPARRASDRPIAIACLRLVTLRPDPLFNVPRLRSRIARATFCLDFAP